MNKEKFSKEKCNSCMFKEEIDNYSLINCSKSNSNVSSNPLKIDNFTYPLAFSIHDIYACSGYRTKIDLIGLSKEQLADIINQEHQILCQILQKQSVASLELFTRVNDLKLFDKITMVFSANKVEDIPLDDLLELAEIYIKL